MAGGESGGHGYQFVGIKYPLIEPLDKTRTEDVDCGNTMTQHTQHLPVSRAFSQVDSSVSCLLRVLIELSLLAAKMIIL